MKKEHPDSLTPQRKHRKLLKDGSGSEVWPEAIEKTFVHGLREYWASPYATYSQSRGRSRWRNQFLVDYLQRHGIHRTKKQVASHIQVLRNMWKGQPEFHLVAGGDEQVDPVTHIPIKEEHPGHLPFDWDDRESSHSASPDFSPPDSQSDFPLTPEQKMFPLDAYAAVKQENSSPGSLYGVPMPSSTSHHHNHLAAHSPSTSPVGNYQHHLPDPLYSNPSTTSTSSYPRGYPQNRVTTLYLYAEGMTPFSVNVDALGQQSSSSGSGTNSSNSPRPASAYGLRIKLSVPMVNDPRSPPLLHGFTASVAIATNMWSGNAKCVTKVLNGASNTCFLEESDALQVSYIGNGGAVHAMLPESNLSRCRWLDPNTSSTLTQELIVDDQVLLYLIYDLDRKNGFMPSAEFLGFQQYRPDKMMMNSSSSSPATFGMVPSTTSTAAASSSSSSLYPSSTSSSRGVSSSQHHGLQHQQHFSSSSSAYGASPAAYSIPMIR